MGRGAGPKSQLSRLAIHGRTSLRNGNGEKGTVQLIDGSVEVKNERRKRIEKDKKNYRVNGKGRSSKFLSTSQLSVSLWDPLAREAIKMQTKCTFYQLQEMHLM